MLIKWLGNNFDDFLKSNPVGIEFNLLGKVVKTVPSSSHEKPKTYGTYLLVHSKTKKCYVGSHNNIYSRPYQHNSLLNLQKHWNTDFQNKFNDCSDLMVMFIITNDRETAYDIEQELLDKCLNKGLLFNIAKDARLANKGLEVSEETRLKLSLAGSNRILTIAHKNNIRIANTGHKHSLETIDLIRQKAKQRKLPDSMSILAALVNSIKIYIDGKVYNSKKEAGLQYGITSNSVTKRILSKNFPNWNLYSDIFNKPILVNGIEYSSIDAYSIKTNLNIALIKTRIESNIDVYNNWKYF